MLQWLTIFLIIFALAYNYALFYAPPPSLQPSFYQILKRAANPNSIRQDYGEYGRDFSEDYKKFREANLPKSTADSSFYAGETRDVSLGLAANSSQKFPNDPSGIHGNNYSVYDINSPGGPFSQP